MADWEGPFKKKSKYKFPTTLHGFNYTFDKEGKLRNMDTDAPFEFNARDGDHEYNQARYEALGEVVTRHMYNLVEMETGLKRHYIPLDARDEDPQTFIFLSPGALENPDKLLVIVHGSGVVRAGQWARRLIINDCLETGSQIPYIKRALSEGYSVIVLNSNDNEVYVNGRRKAVKYNDRPENHILYVHDHFLKHASAKHIAFVAHSYGGEITVHLVNSRPELTDRLFAVAFTDSVHSLEMQYVHANTVNFIKKNARNWVSSDQPLDAVVASRSKKDCQCVSAGHRQHEMTSSSAIESVFRFLDEKYPSGARRSEPMDEL